MYALLVAFDLDPSILKYQNRNNAERPAFSYHPRDVVSPKTDQRKPKEMYTTIGGLDSSVYRHEASKNLHFEIDKLFFLNPSCARFREIRNEDAILM
jgi:hypothetical protein